MKKTKKKKIKDMSAWLQVRIDPSDSDLFKDVAQSMGLSMSGWIRMTLLDAVKRRTDANQNFIG